MIVQYLVNFLRKLIGGDSDNIYDNSDKFIRYLKNKGILIGEGVFFQSPQTACIDITRPSLVDIGENCTFLENFTLLTHDFVTKVFRNKYGDFLNSSGKVSIGNNVFFTRNCTVLKGVSIGDNCIIGYGSVVTKDIPDNSVVAGCPAKVICTLDDFYEKRKVKCVEEAFEYARSIEERFKRKPVPEDFWEEFPLFVSGNEVDKYPLLPYHKQLKDKYTQWTRNHKAKFSSFEDFLKAAGIKL